MDSSTSNIECDWDCVSEINSVISMSTFGSVEPTTIIQTLHSSREVFASFRDALASNMSNQENETIPSTNIIAHGVEPKKSIAERKVETKLASFHRTNHDNDQEMRKLMQAQKRRKDRLSQTNLQTRFSDKRSKTKFHRMKRCCARSQTKQHVEEAEDLYIPRVNHKSLSWWDCVGDNDLRMARPRWKV